MKCFQYSDKDLLQAFMKTAQYLAGLTAHEDVWRHIAKLMVNFYRADSAGFARRRADGEIETHHMITSDLHPSLCLFSKEVQEIASEVFESGFLAWRTLGTCEESYTVVFLPVVIGAQTAEVMLVGHATAGPVENDVLNVYLAIAGLAGTTITRLISETELKKHRSHLEKLVSERTSELTLTLGRLELEITGHMQAEKELRTIRDHLEELVETRTAELEKANRELKTYSTKLERINEELSEFAFVASHDLQEPLRKIQTFCDMAQHRCALDIAGREYLDRILSSATRMRQLLRDLLQFSRVATIVEPFKEIDLHKIVMEAADIFEKDILETGCSVGIENVPIIEADETQMLQLFQNLIGNALKYRSSENPLIKIRGRRDGKEFCEISVEDNGIGFEQQFERLIFKPFQRLHARSEYEGTGMGLAICRKIVELHGGSIRAESEPGRGTTFVIRLPMKRDRQENIGGGKGSTGGFNG
ncbi:MAG: ATP-binding protein [Syntrophobacteraceae bacterium]